MIQRLPVLLAVAVRVHSHIPVSYWAGRRPANKFLLVVGVALVITAQARILMILNHHVPLGNTNLKTGPFLPRHSFLPGELDAASPVSNFLPSIPPSSVLRHGVISYVGWLIVLRKLQPTGPTSSPGAPGVRRAQQRKRHPLPRATLRGDADAVNPSTARSTPPSGAAPIRRVDEQ